jgi:hypothetical protein
MLIWSAVERIGAEAPHLKLNINVSELLNNNLYIVKATDKVNGSYMKFLSDFDHALGFS